MHQASLGGAERQGLSLGKIFTEKYGCKVYLLLTFSEKTSAEFDDYASKCHIKETFFFGEPYIVLKREWSYKNLKRLVWSIKYLLRLRNGLKSYKIDLIFPYLNFPSKIAFYLYKLLPTAKFAFWHQLGLDTFKDDIFENYSAKNVPCIIANAPTGVDLFQKAHPKSKRPLYVLPQFLAIDYVIKPKAELSNAYGIPPDRVVIGMVAHYRLDKLHGLLLNVFGELLKENNAIQLVLLGNKRTNKVTEMKFQQLKDTISAKNINEHVCLLSEKPVEDVLNIIDIGVLVSEIEGTPNAVMEYMAYGLPVVATNHPGCKLLLQDSNFLIENQEEDLAEVLKMLIKSSELRKSEGEKNKELIKKRNPEAYLNQLSSIIDEFYE